MSSSAASTATTGAAVSLSSADLVVPNARPLKEGYLTKRSEWMLLWRRRFFRLVGSQLFFSRAPGDPPHGVIELRHCLTVKSAEDKTGRAHAFEVATSEKVFFMHADSDEDKDDWIGKIGRAIVESSRSQIRAHVDTSGAGAEDSDDDDDDDDDS